MFFYRVMKYCLRLSVQLTYRDYIKCFFVKGLGPTLYLSAVILSSNLLSFLKNNPVLYDRWYNYFLFGDYFESCRLVYLRPTIFLLPKFCNMDGLSWCNMHRKAVAHVKKKKLRKKLL